MEPYLVLADKHVNGRRDGLAFSALPDAPILAPRAPRLLRRQVTRLACAGPSCARRRATALGEPSSVQPRRTGHAETGHLRRPTRFRLLCPAAAGLRQD